MSNQIERGFQIIENLAKFGQLDIDEIHAHTAIPRSTIFKLLVNLESQGYILRKNFNGRSDFWSLTIKFLKISRLILSRISFKDEIKDVLINLSKETKETVQLGVYSNKKFMYIDVIEKPGSIISYLGVGTEFPVNLSAAGMVLAAALPDEELNELLKNTVFPKNTPYSITEPDKIKKMIKKVKADGYAFDNEYYYIGIRCLAAPVYNFEEKTIAAINITGHVSTMSDKNIDFLKMKLLKASLEASKIMGFEHRDSLA